MTDSLGIRQKSYETHYDYTITPRLPIIVRADGKSFSRLTRKLERPFCLAMLKVMSETMLNTIMEMQGAVLGYQQSDEITFVLRNDQSFESEPWFQNRVQKVSSMTAAQATLCFNEAIKKPGISLDLVGSAIFDARTFAVPSISEVVNNLIWRQQECMKNAVTMAAQTELSEKFGKKTALKILHKKNTYEKKGLLLQHCGIDFDEYYPPEFRKGVVAIKSPSIIQTETGSATRNKWGLNLDIPVFMEDKDYVFNIILNGADVFRVSNITNV